MNKNGLKSPRNAFKVNFVKNAKKKNAKDFGIHNKIKNLQKNMKNTGHKIT
jgi:hypothetical protein